MVAGSEGDAWIDIHANTNPFENELDPKLRKAGADADAVLKEIGESWGEKISKSAAEEIGKHGNDFAKSMERSTAGKRIKQRIRPELDQEGFFHDLKQTMADAENIVRDTFDNIIKRESKPNGFFDKLSTGIADAIGAGFNVSGRSPLIAVLIPAILGLVGLILGALQGVNSLIAALSTLPALLGAISIQAGVLYLAFQGVGGAIKAALTTTDLSNLEPLLKNLTPAARNFVLSLLPLGKLLKDLKAIVQDRFFTTIGTSFGDLAKTIGVVLRGNIGPLATALGGLFRSLALFFGSPSFIKFIDSVIPATVIWLDQFGPALVLLLQGFADFSVEAMPFLLALGSLLNSELGLIGQMFSDLAKDPSTAEWFYNMRGTFIDLVELGGQLIEFFATFLAQLDKAGGEKVLGELIEALMQITFVLASPAGLKAMEGFVHIAIFGIDAFFGLLEVILFVVGALESMWDFILGTLYPGIGDFVKSVGQFFADLTKLIVIALGWLLDQIGKFIIWIAKTLQSWKESWKGSAKEAATQALQMILGVFGDLPDKLYEKGVKAIKGLVNGIKSGIGELGGVMGGIAGKIAGFLGSSPAKEGPLSGSGWTESRGRRMIRSLAEGIRAEGATTLGSTMTTTLNTLNFGGVSLNFYGQQPTEADARRAGAAAGDALASRLAVRDTELAIRTM